MQFANRLNSNGGQRQRQAPGPFDALLRAVRRHWTLAAAVPVLVIGATALALLFLPREYEASAQLRIDQQRSNLAVLDALQSLTGGSQIETEMVVLRSRTLVEGVIDSLGLRASLTRPRRAVRSRFIERIVVSPAARAGEWIIRPGDGGVDVTPARGPGEARHFAHGEPLQFDGVDVVLARDGLAQSELRLRVVDRLEAVRRFQRKFTVARPNREADVVRIGYTSTDSTLVRDVVNTAVRHFIGRRQNEQNSEAVDMVAFLTTQIDTLTVQLTSAEEALRAYSERSGIIAMQAQAESWVTRLADLKAQRDLADTERRALSALVTAARAPEVSLRSVVGFPSILRSPSASELVRALNEAENVRAVLLQRYTLQDPDVQVQTQRIGELEDQLRAIANSYLAGLNNTVASLDEVLAGYENELQRVPQQEISLARLRRQASVLEEIHTLLRTRVKEAEIAASVRDSSVRLVDPAIVPGRPVRPRPALSLALATVMGLGLGLAGAVLRDHLDRTVRTRDELQTALPHLPILSVIPHARVNGTGAIGVVENETAPAEAYRQLRTNLTFAQAERPRQAVVFTSPTPGDGKSMTAVNLAATFAQQGARCILIDADMRRGSLHESLHTTRDPGLSQVLANQVPLTAAIRSVSLPGGLAELDFVPGGVHPPNPAELLASPRLKTLIDACRQEYDAIVIDAPPLNLVTDASLIGAVADGVLVVVRAGVTRTDALDFAMDQLEAVRAPVLGIVLNDVNPRTQGYYGRYAGYYGRQPT